MRQLIPKWLPSLGDATGLKHSEKMSSKDHHEVNEVTQIYIKSTVRNAQCVPYVS